MVYKTPTGSKSPKRAHLLKLKEMLKTTHDPVLRAHMRQLMREWGVRVRLPKIQIAA